MPWRGFFLLFPEESVSGEGSGVELVSVTIILIRIMEKSWKNQLF